MAQPDRDIVAKFIAAAPANYARSRKTAIQGIVIHTMVGSLAGTDRWFSDPTVNKGGPANASAHYGVGLNGVIHQYVREANAAFHAGIKDNPKSELVKRLGGNPNDYTLGIETEDKGNPNIARPEAQIAAVTELVYRMCVGYGIKPSGDTIIPHHDVRASKTCPGNFPVAEVIRRVRARFTKEGRPV